MIPTILFCPMPRDLAADCASGLRLARDKNKVISNVLFCDKCHVSLCVACFKPFHTISDVKKLKSEVMKNKGE